jgi:hypothetical protein
MLTLLLIALALAGALMPHVDTNFEGGSAGRVESINPQHLRVAVKGEADQDGRNRQANWYYFRVRGAVPGQTLQIDLVDLPGEYNYKSNRGAVTGDTPAVWSEDQRTWNHIADFTYHKDAPVMTLRVTPRRGTLWIAHTPPYTNLHLSELRKWAGRHQAFREETVGRSVKGRPIRLWTIGGGAPRAIWLMFRQHSWESGTSWVGEGVVRELLSEAALRQGIVWKILPMCDPDGVARGGVRFNHFGYDLNRNWDSPDSPRMPEIAAQRAAIRRWLEAGKSVDLFLTFHNTETAEYLEGPPERQDAAVQHEPLARQLFHSLEAGTTFAPTQPLLFAESTTAAGKPGRMTVIQGLSHDFGIAAFLMEQRISFNPRLGRLPLVEDRLDFGRQLVHAVSRIFQENR